MTNKPVSGKPGQWAELREALSAADVRSDWLAPELVAGPELFLVSPDVPVWRRWLTRWPRDPMLVLTAVGTACAIALVVLAIVG
jgi:hypothetical protein